MVRNKACRTHNLLVLDLPDDFFRFVPEAKKRLAVRKSSQPQLTITTLLLNLSYFLTECYRPDYEHL